MAVFVIFRATNPDAVRAAITEKFADEFIELQSDEWLVSASVTAKELSDTLGITGGKSASLGSAIVAKIGAYYGRAPTDVWDFIKTKSESAE